MKYRPEIDGLRALAVTCVILSHAGIPLFKGGYVGVDIFFVISGYLITLIISEATDKGRFSLLGFYERRARRIMPALLAVILVVSPFAWCWMLPDYLENYGQSIVATLLFANNLMLAKTSGYWDLESSFKPFLHTWSLGVEEQFYIVFPLVMSACASLSRRSLLLCLSVAAAVSFAAAEIGASAMPAVNFYLPFGRAWELLAGSLCALSRIELSDRMSAGLAWAGLTSILASVLLLPEAIPVPSAVLLPVVVGSAMVILFAGAANWVGRLLALRPLVALGLISYSAYLWHQPIFALARVRLQSAPDWHVMTALAAAVVPIAYLSWRYIEQPFRNATFVSRSQFMAAIPILSVVCLGYGLYLHMTHGLPQRIFPNADEADLYIAYNERIRDYKADAFPVNGRQNVLVIGNSTARDIANAMLEGGFLDSRNIVYREDVPPRCDGFADEMQVYPALFRQADYVVVTGMAPECAAAAVHVAQGLEKRVLAVGPKDFGYNLNPYINVPNEERHLSRATPRPEAESENDRYRDLIPAAAYLNLIQALGGDGHTVPVFDAAGNILSQDRVHFTRYGARFAAPMVVAVLQALPPPIARQSSLN